MSTPSPSPLSSPKSSSAGSYTSTRDLFESIAMGSFLRAAHCALPSTTINSVKLTVTGPGRNRPRITRRFSLAGAGGATVADFTASRAMYVDATLTVGSGLPAPTNTAHRIYFKARGGEHHPAYTNPAYEELQIDYLAKVVLPEDFQWTAPAGSAVTRMATTAETQLLPMPPGGSGGRRASIDATPGSDAASTLSDGSTRTAKHYPRGSTHYIIGEASTTPTPQKLLQMERSLRFLLVKEHKCDICEVVGGAMFLGGGLRGAAVTALACALEHYRTALPLCAALYDSGRMLCVDVPPQVTAAVDAVITNARLLAMGEELTETRNEVSRLAEILRRNGML